MKRILMLLGILALVTTASAIQDCDKFEKAPLDTECNIIGFAVNTSNSSQFYTDATCTIDIVNVTGSLEVDDGVMESNSDGSYNYSFSSISDGFAYYQITCVKDTDFGGVGGSVNFGFTNEQYLIEINGTVHNIDSTVTNITTELAAVNDTLIDINETMGDINTSLSNLTLTIQQSNNESENQTGLMRQFLQVLEDTYELLFDANEHFVDDKFHLLIDDNSDFSMPEVNRRLTTSNFSIDLSPIYANNTLIYWKVRSIDGSGFSVWSETFQATTNY